MAGNCLDKPVGGLIGPARPSSSSTQCMQEALIEALKTHTGVIYVGLDAWQSPNGFDVLGTLIVEKFGLKNKICGIVTDNTSNNQTMIEDIQSLKWPQFKGNPKKPKSHWLKTSDNDPDDPDDADQQIQLLAKDTADSEDEGGADDIASEDALVADLVDHNEIELKDEDISGSSDEEEGDQYSSKSCKETLTRFREISRKLNESPNSKVLFLSRYVMSKVAPGHIISHQM
ncbi:hypothetical protein PSTG_04974 [Puccinia striiformis f. sp. tritici PST-78]|uniref:Uncharacterized protein n=1 Tax=Puccinia striiformis f. sp. tritici PST-78 TaxID=1165861 RepID=A0A0L0VRF7_9BASI|nr:hypothetical protein PSTG_04974 [Puccinia striiformis f. sp. tritici PST-78]